MTPLLIIAVVAAVGVLIVIPFVAAALVSDRRRERQRARAEEARVLRESRQILSHVGREHRHRSGEDLVTPYEWYQLKLVGMMLLLAAFFGCLIIIAYDRYGRWKWKNRAVQHKLAAFPGLAEFQAPRPSAEQIEEMETSEFDRKPGTPYYSRAAEVKPDDDTFDVESLRYREKQARSPKERDAVVVEELDLEHRLRLYDVLMKQQN